MSPKISIITISFRAVKEIRETIESVLAQTFTDYEYLFIDGASKDGTVELIESYRAAFEEKGVAYHVVSEPDKGIYDAMNKGVAKATGEWIVMMNAGDSFVDGKVLEDLFLNKSYDADILYGDTILREHSKKAIMYKRSNARPLYRIDESMAFCHQSSFVRRTVLQKYGFDMQYKIAADYDLFVRTYQDGVPFQHVPRLIAMFDCGGIGMARPHITMSECTRVRQNAGLVPRNPLWTDVLQIAKGYLRNLAVKALPKLFYSEARGWRTTPPTDEN